MVLPLCTRCRFTYQVILDGRESYKKDNDFNFSIVLDIDKLQR
jgi:hypothetical protein